MKGMEYRPSLYLGVVAIEKGALGSPSTKVADFTNDATTKERKKSRSVCDSMETIFYFELWILLRNLRILMFMEFFCLVFILPYQTIF